MRSLCDQGLMPTRHTSTLLFVSQHPKTKLDPNCHLARQLPHPAQQDNTKALARNQLDPALLCPRAPLPYFLLTFNGPSMAPQLIISCAGTSASLRAAMFGLQPVSMPWPPTPTYVDARRGACFSCCCAASIPCARRRARFHPHIH